VGKARHKKLGNRTRRLPIRPKGWSRPRKRVKKKGTTVHAKKKKEPTKRKRNGDSRLKKTRRKKKKRGWFYKKFVCINLKRGGAETKRKAGIK